MSNLILKVGERILQHGKQYIRLIIHHLYIILSLYLILLHKITRGEEEEEHREVYDDDPRPLNSKEVRAI